MILQVSPEAPAWMHAGAAALLFLHIGGGATGIVSGAVAVAARKGGRLHRAAGTVFFVAMLFMAGVGAAVAPFLPALQAGNTLAGLFTLYLLITAWMTVRRRPGEVGRFEVASTMMAASIAVIAFVLARTLATGPQASLYRVIYVFAVLGTLAAVCDLSVVLRHGLSGASRIARHLWRMCLAWFVASGSFFLGQQKVMPDFIKGSPVLIVLAVTPLVLLIFWLLRVWFTKAFRSGPSAPRAPRRGGRGTAQAASA